MSNILECGINYSARDIRDSRSDDERLILSSQSFDYTTITVTAYVISTCLFHLLSGGCV
jgi:hypothetical protein